MTVAVLALGSRLALDELNEHIRGCDSSVCFARLSGLEFGTRSERAPQVFV